jgi:quercetin dioxygenase-like cupin family protein
MSKYNAGRRGMATATTTYSVLSLGEEAEKAAERGFGLGPAGPNDGRRGRVYVRRDLDISSFGVNAFYQGVSGAPVIGEHEEVGPGASGHEELYVVVEGGATFTVDGDEIDAPRGTAVFVQAGTKRAAVATEDGTIVLVVGGTPGRAWSKSPGESMAGFFSTYREKDYEGALAILRRALEEHPGNALMLYNVACMEACLGNTEAVWEPLAQALAAWPRFKEQAADDEDFGELREDPRFKELVAA